MTYVGQIADYDGRGTAGARLLGAALADRLGLEQTIVGHPTPETDRCWQSELAAAAPSLAELKLAHSQVLAGPQPALIVLPRCAAALATLPNLAGTDALVVWFDAHADLNTPISTTSGYIGGMVLSAAVGWWDSGYGNGLSPDDIILGGTRDFDPFEESLVEDEVIKCAAGASLLEDLDAYLSDRPVYFHLDCDVLEPGIVPTEYPVADGLLLSDLSAVAERLARNRVIGVEIAEFETPPEDNEIDGSGARLLDALAPLLRLA